MKPAMTSRDRMSVTRRDRSMSSRLSLVMKLTLLGISASPLQYNIATFYAV